MALPRHDASAAESASTEPIVSRQHSVSTYVADMARDLKGLSSNAELHFLGYLLAVVEEEARTVSKHSRPEE